MKPLMSGSEWGGLPSAPSPSFAAVKDLVAGSGIRFEDRGVHILKEAPGEWRFFAVEAEPSPG